MGFLFVFQLLVDEPPGPVSTYNPALCLLLATDSRQVIIFALASFFFQSATSCGSVVKRARLGLLAEEYTRAAGMVAEMAGGLRDGWGG